METKTIKIELTEAEADHLWNFFAGLKMHYRFTNGRDLKLVTAILKKLKEAARAAHQ
jgi:hypothetical protein